MAIPVSCQCGKNYQAKEELAGRQLKCSTCGQVLAVPQPTVPDAELDLGDLSGFDLGAQGSGEPLAVGVVPAPRSSQYPGLAMARCS